MRPSPHTSRLLALPAAAVLCLGLAAGCGSDSSSDSTSSDAASDSSDSGGPPSGGGGMGGEADCSDAGTPTAAADGAVPDGANEAAATDVASVVDAAQAFTATLDDEQTASLSFDYDDLEAKECSWSNFPDGLFDGRAGLRLGDLSDEQVAAAEAVLQAAMSEAGYTYVTQEMQADDQLASGADDTMFGSQNYHVAFYGDPSTDEAWGLQFGGHHLAVMVSLGGDTLSVSPYFKGAQPVSYELDGQTIEPMGTLADDFFGIFTSMDADAQAAAQLDGDYTDLVMGPQSDTDYPATEGTAYTDLTDAQQAQVRSVIEGYVADYAGALADPLVELYESQLDETTVAWATGLDQTSAAYLRIDGPRLWIEWVDTPNPGESGIHLHTIYRDKELDYGTGTGS